MMLSQEYLHLEEQYGARNYKPLDVVLNRGEGVWVWDVEGSKYLDCLSAYSAVNQGHCHPKIMETMIEQARKLTLTSRAFRNDQLGLFYRDLCELTNSHKILPMNTGAEAVETTIKAARKWGYTVKGLPREQAEIIVCERNFHGRTITITGFSTDDISRKYFGPYTPGFKIIPFDDVKALQEAITPCTVALMVEPIQGEAGVIVPAPGYLREVKQVCESKSVLLILDEIQTGLGRTGKLLAEEHDGIEADLTIVGKALAGGFYPISAVMSNTEVMDVLQPGEHGSTFGGNPLACAVARTALKVLIEEGMIENASEVGAYFLYGLKQINNPLIKEIRGKGLMIGMELYPEAGGARRYCEELKQKGLLCKETHDHVIRFAPPLVITKADIDWALNIIEDVFTAK
ncbi:MAG: ornithine--oxo-acid transaminase [Deltaproteobacteria bacterium]|nr:ornithine--oxo-acid transaminase [Deltaproteobacteria bacterium]